MSTNVLEKIEAPQETGLAKPSEQPPRRAMAVATDDGEFANLLDTNKFEHMWRVAGVFAASNLVPVIFRGKREDCFVAVQMAVRLGVDPFMFLQNTYPAPGGKPGMEGKLAIALINSSGKFKGQLKYELDGTGDDFGCVAWGIDKATGERVDGPRVTIGIAKREGWYDRNPKWKNVPDLMLRYRSGAWFGRLNCPERLMGMQTRDEMEDIGRKAGGASATRSSRAKSVLAKVLVDEPSSAVAEHDESTDPEVEPEVEAPRDDNDMAYEAFVADARQKATENKIADFDTRYAKALRLASKDEVGNPTVKAQGDIMVSIESRSGVWA